MLTRGTSPVSPVPKKAKEMRVLRSTLMRQMQGEEEGRNPHGHAGRSSTVFTLNETTL
jgi:hypothetical protein